MQRFPEIVSANCCESGHGSPGSAAVTVAVPYQAEIQWKEGVCHANFADKKLADKFNKLLMELHKEVINVFLKQTFTATNIETMAPE